MTQTALPVVNRAAELAQALAAGDTVLSGLRGSALSKLLADARRYLSFPLLVMVDEPEHAADLIGDLSLFGAGEELYHFPPWDLLPSECETPDLEIAADRVAALRVCREPGRIPPIIVTPIPALLQPTLSPQALRQGHLSVRPGLVMPPTTLVAHLLDAGFEATAQVDSEGQFCRRAGIVDVFPLFAERPLRLEWFGDEIDTLREFDPSDQRSHHALDEERLLIDVSRESFRIAYAQEKHIGLWDHLPSDTRVVLVHPEQLRHRAELYESGFDPRTCPLFGLPLLAAGLAPLRFLTVPELAGETWDTDLWRSLDRPRQMELATKSLERLSGSVEHVFRELRMLAEEGVRLTVFCHNRAERARLQELLLEKGHGLADRVELLLGHLAKGFELAAENLSAGGEAPRQRPAAASAWAVIGDQELFGRFALRRTPRRRYAGTPITDFTDLKTGDYVVHIANGIARYEGITLLESNGTSADYLTLRFAEDARIYVPLSHVELVQRYVGTKGVRPRLSKLGGKRWSQKKRQAAKAARDIAAELLRMQAVRRAVPGIAYAPDESLQREFEAAFPYEETPDQAGAVLDIKADQERAAPMDRLLCGDVGFGKTELAIRAAFKVVTAGKQVAVLVPTTILAEQHYRTFRERTAEYPVLLACLSRFRSAGEQRRIVEDLKEGRVDIVIGTHRLLSKDIGFKDLGLVVIDEEQRFGVEHKERLKSMRAAVDVLTMTATPIPRTLNLALLGLRDISNLATPPTDRQAIRTRVIRYSDELVRRAILREVSRGGQCFFLHNRVNNIDSIAAHLSGLVPEARFGIAHGQMPEKQLLEVMSRFLDRRIDVLVCTTIIESGVDIPTVNTLFVNEADHFGLSELHQLRGRVGRYRYQAYAYFLVPPRRPVNPVAQKRLTALEEYSELGAGFRIAMRDLEIRGAGNILGVQQSGHIHSIGFDLYCRLLERAAAEFRGEPMEEVEPVELDLGTRAFIPTAYLDADELRIEFYRRLARARDAEALERLLGYVTDRYGPPPPEVERLFQDQTLRNLCADADVNFLGRTENALVVGFAEGKGKSGVVRLRSMRRKVTVLDRARWRVELSASETGVKGLLKVVDEVLAALTR